MTDHALPAVRQIWVAEALLDGHAEAEVVARLEEAGTPAALAADAVREIASSPALLVARRRLLAHRLRVRVAQAGEGAVEDRPDLDARAFRDTYVALGVPVRIPGFCADWPLAAWTLEDLAARFGDVEVPVAVGRGAVREPDRRTRELTQTLPLAEVIRRVEAGEDLYLVAQHRVFEGPLAPLLDAVTPAEGFADRARLRGGASLWLGPAGTRTALHHDVSSVLFCQVLGRKRVVLVPPFADGVAATARDFYASVRLDDPAARAPGGALHGIPVSEVELGPGDALLLPAGWWHEVVALETSLSVSLVGMPWPNRFDDHVAGRVA
ncbi:MAG: cupin-like domain-containing protein [Alphaproteobacteria bacterium]|nr:cupin-like domain-containing protein [Alphaproteobacteria bacterium]